MTPMTIIFIFYSLFILSSIILLMLNPTVVHCVYVGLTIYVLALMYYVLFTTE